MSKNTYSNGRVNRIWNQLERILKVGQKVQNLTSPEVQIGSIKLGDHLDRLGRLFEEATSKIGPNPDCAFGILEIQSLCNQAMSELLSDDDIEVIVRVEIVYA